MNSQTFNVQRYTYISEEVYRLNSCTLVIGNIDIYVQIPRLSRTLTKIPGLSRPEIQILKFQDFPGFQGPVQTL